MPLTLLICKQNIPYILYPFSQLNISFNSTHFKKVIYFLYRPTCPLKDTYFILVLVFRFFQHEKITFFNIRLCNTFYFSTGFQSKRHFPLTRCESKIIFLDFHSTNGDSHWLTLGHMALTKIKCIPSWYRSNVPRSGYITARDQSMVESGVTEGGKNTARSCQFSFSWMNTTTQTRSLKLKSNDF